MINIVQLDYVDKKGKVMKTFSVNIWYGLHYLDLYLKSLRDEFNEDRKKQMCAEVLCQYKDYSKHPKQR